MKQSVSRRLMTLGLGASLAFGIAGLQSPAEAKPPSHAKAWGYRRKHTTVRRVTPKYRVAGYRNTVRYRDVDRDGIPDYRDRFIRSSRYPYRKDLDRDGVRNKRDKDKDGDGIRNRRDDHDKNPRRR
jgi:hypothetical protein